MAELTQYQLHPRMLAVFRAFIEQLVRERVKISIRFLFDLVQIFQELCI